MSYMRRREFLTLLGGAAAWPLAARAQEPMMPVVGYLNLESPGSASLQLANLKRGLNQAGYFEGRDFVIEYRWARNQADRLPALVADLVQLRAAVIIAVGSPSALAAKAVTTSIPIVFVVANDPVQLGLVASLNRPGSNLTGFNVGQRRRPHHVWDGLDRGVSPDWRLHRSDSQGREASRPAGVAADQI